MLATPSPVPQRDTWDRLADSEILLSFNKYIGDKRQRRKSLDLALTDMDEVFWALRKLSAPCREEIISCLQTLTSEAEFFDNTAAAASRHDIQKNHSQFDTYLRNAQAENRVKKRENEKTLSRYDESEKGLKRALSMVEKFKIRFRQDKVEMENSFKSCRALLPGLDRELDMER